VRWIEGALSNDKHTLMYSEAKLTNSSTMYKGRYSLW